MGCKKWRVFAAHTIRESEEIKKKPSWKETMSNFKTAKCAMLAGIAAIAFATPAAAQLDDAMRTAKASTAASAASQQSVESLDDQADNMARDYSALLQQKDNLDLFVARQDLYLESQNSEMDSLREQLQTIEATKQGMVPMMLKMAVELEDTIKADYPFELGNRLNRIEEIKSVLVDPALTPVDQYRKLLTAYQIEVSYGQGVGSYEGPHPTDANQTVDFIRFGRVAFVYMTKDESEISRYNLGNGTWEQVEGKIALEMRQAIRMARGEARMDMLRIPVVAQ